MYLQPAEAEGAIGAVSSIAADDSWIGLDAVNPEMLDSPYTKVYMKRLADAGAPWHFGMANPELLFARHGWGARVVMPGDPDASFGRWPFPAMPRSIPGIPRTFFVTATKGAAAQLLPVPVSTASAEHYEWGQHCDGWHLVRNDSISVIQEQMPPGAAEQRHRHAKARQFFYVLNGKLELEMEGTTHTLAAGSGLEVPPGAAHRASNPGPEAVAFLLVSQPPAQDDRDPT
jgi:quercetin dioxygenase-like cupin family protein